MTQWIVIASLVTSVFAALACSDSKEPASERTSGGEVGDKLDDLLEQQHGQAEVPPGHVGDRARHQDIDIIAAR